MGVFETAQAAADVTSVQDADSAPATAADNDPPANEEANGEDKAPGTPKGDAAVSEGAAGGLEDDDKEEWDRVDLENGRRFRDADDQSKKMLMLLQHFTPDQLRRYENYRRAGFQRSHIKKIMMNATGGSTVPSNSVIVMAGIAKVFCGEVVEMAVQVQQEWKHDGQLRPTISAKLCAA